MNNTFKDRIEQAWQSLSSEGSDEKTAAMNREKVAVFVICIFLAFALWMIVNLNIEYSIDIQVPVELGNISTNKALATALPDDVTASIMGTGWNLISTYKDPPEVYVDVSGKEVNLFEQVRQQISSTSENVTVQKVSPLYLQVKLEEKSSKKVPVKPNVQIQVAKQYAFLNDPVVSPDSVVIRGATSRIAKIDAWPTDSLTFSDAKDSITTSVNLKNPGSLISLSASKVNYHVNIAQFTEGEVTVPVETRDFPMGNVVTFSPSSVDIKYQIPLQEYANFSKKSPFKAYVAYGQIKMDTTGFVTPQIQKLPQNMRLKVKLVQPQEVAYFTIIRN